MAREEAQAVLELAIRKEQEAHQLYQQAAQTTTDRGVKALTTELAEEELNHIRVLKSLELDRLQEHELSRIQTLGISDFLVDKPTLEGAALQDVLIFAMKREEKAHSFMASMAQAVEDSLTRKLLEILAQEELKHKDRLETFYEQVFLKEN